MPGIESRRSGSCVPRVCRPSRRLSTQARRHAGPPTYAAGTQRAAAREASRFPAEVDQGSVREPRRTHACFPQAHFGDERAGLPGRRVGQAHFCDERARPNPQTTSECVLGTGPRGTRSESAPHARMFPSQAHVGDEPARPPARLSRRHATDRGSGWADRMGPRSRWAGPVGIALEVDFGNRQGSVGGLLAHDRMAPAVGDGEVA